MNMRPGWIRHLYRTFSGGTSSTPVSEAITSTSSVVTRYRHGRSPFRSRIAQTLVPSVPMIRAGPSHGSIRHEWYS